VGNIEVESIRSNNDFRPHISLARPVAEFSDQHGGLRDFIRALDQAGLLARIREEIDWKFDIGTMTREIKRPLLFENIKGYPNRRVFTNGLCNVAAMRLALGLEGGTTQEGLLSLQKRIASPIAPNLVETGPVLENVVNAQDINLFELPVPWWHREDAGRFIGTWHINVTKDPETGSRNVGVYRMQLLGERQMTLSASPRSHLSCHFAKSEKAGCPLPMAVAIGVGETLIMAAASAYPIGVDEYEFAGALQKEPVRLIPCQTVELEVPAQSEIVIEGLIHPGVRVQDGPYFDYTGRPNTNPNAFLFEASQVMFRSDPIFRGASIGAPGAEDHQLFALLANLNLVNFHGSTLKQKFQNALLKQRFFRGFQFMGKLGSTLRGKKDRWTPFVQRRVKSSANPDRLAASDSSHRLI
jgi:UbiD family decarboxylase